MSSVCLVRHLHQIWHALLSYESVFPRMRTAVASLGALVIFVALGIPALIPPTDHMKDLVPWVAYGLLGVLMAMVVLDSPPLFARYFPSVAQVLCPRSRALKRGGYRPILAATVLTVLLVLPIMTPLYMYQWYPARFTWVQQQSSQSEAEIPHPMITFVQDVSSPFQANIIAPADCYIGQTSDAPLCDEYSADEIAEIGGRGLLADSSCNCSNQWTEVQTSFISDSKRFLQFVPSSNLVASSPQVFLNLLFTWNIDYSQWHNKIQVVAPGLWMLLNDRSVDGQTAYQSGTGEYTLVNVAALTLVTMSPTFFVDRTGVGRYQYHPTLASQAQLDMQCDISGMHNANTSTYKECKTHLLFRIQTFEASIITEVRSMDGADVAEAVGAWFALIQVIVWIISGMAIMRA